MANFANQSHEKARRYIALLDAALCNEAWQEIPELTRKVTKHAPDRKCLVATAQAEHEIAQHLARSRPSTAQKPSSNLMNLIPPLLSAIENETGHPQDVLQAQTCLGWTHWILAEPALTASRLPKDYGAILHRLAEDPDGISGWTEVCLVKGACMKGTSQSQQGSLVESLQTFQSLLAWLQLKLAKGPGPKQFSYWSDQYLAQFALVAAKDQEIAEGQDELAIQAFRLWASKSDQHQDPVLENGMGFVFSSRSQTWKSYYQYLSRLLQRGYVYQSPGDISPRLRQYTELRRVETIYENMLLRTVRFPKAHESSLEIDTWINQVIRNWQVICGGGWSDIDVGQGGKNGVAKAVLDILYRAATRTYHSTLLLRRLFQVHKSIAEFELAYNAFDTYIEIITREKVKAEKAGDAPTYVDDELTILRTVAEGIDGLCCYGSAKEAEKADKIASILVKWTEAQSKEKNSMSNGNSEAREPRLSTPSLPHLDSIAIAHRSIGIARAQWAHYTPFTERRSAIQADAITHLKMSVSLKAQQSPNYEAYFALGLLLAETRDLGGAVASVKEALEFQDPMKDDSPSYTSERKKIPLWHLMALVLSGRQDFATAEQACEAALEQFSSPAILFGHKNSKQQNGNTEKSTAQSANAHVSHHPRGLVDEMEGIELERILEIRITEIALLEVVEGPEIAVNSSDELLSLFLRLFGHLGINLDDKPSAPKVVQSTSSAASTVKSFRGSIFGRKKVNRSSVRSSVLPDRASTRASTVREKDLARTTSIVETPTPTIEVTDENTPGKASNRPHTAHASNQDGHPANHKLHRREGSINRKLREHSEERTKRRPASSYVSSTRQSFETTRERPSRAVSLTREKRRPSSDAQHQSTQDGISAPEIPPAPVAVSLGVNEPSSTAKRELPEISHNYPHTVQPPPVGHKDQPPQQDLRLPITPYISSVYLPHFSQTQARKHALGILVKIWLLIAALYRRASMFEDSREACDEASKHATYVETIVASQESSAKAFADRGWGGTRSSNELWADVYAERGLLAQAKSTPYEAMEHFELALSIAPDHGKATVALSNILLDIYAQKIPPQKPSPDTSIDNETRARPQDDLDLTSRPRTNPSPSSAAFLPPSIDPTSTTNTTTHPTLSNRTATLQRSNSSVRPPTTNTTTNAPSPSSPAKTTTFSNANTTTSNPHQHPISTSPLPTFDLRKTPTNLSRLAARDRAYGLLSTYTKRGTGWDDSEAWFALARAHEEGGEIERAREVLWWCVQLEDGKGVRGVRSAVGGAGGYVL